MLSSSLQLRRSAIAYIFPVTPPNQRKDNLAFYAEVTKHIELPEMQQQPTGLVLLNRTAGPTGHQTELNVGTMPHQVPPPPGILVPTPFRFLVAETNSEKPLKFFVDSADAAYSVFVQVWGTRPGKLQLVEVSLVSTVQAGVPGGALDFLRTRVSRAEKQEPYLGRRIDGVGIKFSSGPAMNIVVGEGEPRPAAQGPLSGTHVDLTIEPAQGDPNLLVLNLIVRWPHLQVQTSDVQQMTDEVRKVLRGANFFELNAEPHSPSVYINQVYQYLEKNVLPFLSAFGR